MSTSFLHRALPTASRTFSTSASTLAANYARMTFIGHLTNQPELQATSTGREILRYGVGVNTGYGENAKASFFNVTSFASEGPQRDLIQRLEKGTLVLVEAEPSMSYYQDAEGKNRSSLNLVQRSLQVISSKNPAGQNAEEAIADAQ